MQVQSAKPKKQRKWFHTKPIHRLKEDFSVHLNEKLRKSIGKRSLEARNGDTVKVVRGNKAFVGKQGKITSVRRKKRQILIEGITRKKMNGTEIQVPFRPSNLELVSIDESDKRRLKKMKKGKTEMKKGGGTEGRTALVGEPSPRTVSA